MVKTAARRVKGEQGSAVVLLVASLGFFLFGAMGLAIDGAQLYAQRQMAQSAADAAVQAGIVTIFDGSTPAIGTSAYYCTSTDTTSPCTYVSKNGYTAGACSSQGSAAPGADCIYVNPNPGVTVSNLDSQTPNKLQVTLTRAVPMTLMKMIGINSLDVTAQATAAIVDVMSPVPIIVTHPSMSGSFSLGGSASITICGGPQRSIQVNSSSSTSLVGPTSATVDLSGASCTPGTGTDFGDFGGPSSPPFTLLKGTTGHYIQPADPILDPLVASVAPPGPAGPTDPPVGSVPAGSNNCPASASTGCVLYHPGIYITTGIGTAGTQPVLFSPGIYYLTGPSTGVGVGFNVSAGGVAMMATGFTDTTTGTGWTSNMLVYLTGHTTTLGSCPAAQTGTIQVTGNGLVNLVGSPSGSAYKGILFFVDRTAATAVHTLGGPGGSITMTGTIYATDSVSQMTCGQYQTLQFQGSGTQIAGKVITSALQVSGSMTVNVDANPVTVRQIALVNGE
ncbi:MAG TPA: Tad domain-containing protein [Bryobacteraceae bacterium]